MGRYSFKLILICLVILAAQICIADTYGQIRHIKPHMSSKETARIAKYIDKSCARYKLDCEVFTAILAQESMFNFQAVNPKTHDYGIGQLNIKTIKSYHIDIDKLLTDEQYAIDRAAFVFAYFNRFKQQESFYFCRYNTGTASYNIIHNRCLLYVNKVQKYMNSQIVTMGEM